MIVRTKIVVNNIESIEKNQAIGKKLYKENDVADGFSFDIIKLKRKAISNIILFIEFLANSLVFLNAFYVIHHYLCSYNHLCVMLAFNTSGRHSTRICL